jgi:hypothetical protein
VILAPQRKGFLAFAVFWWPVWFIAITGVVMLVDFGPLAATTTVVAEVAILLLLAFVS